MKIGILDYEACNLASVYHTVYNSGHDPIILKNKKDFQKVKKIIIPGVGSAYHCMNYLKKNELDLELKSYKKKGMPILGICLGMQIFSKKLYEHGETEGLNFLDGEVLPINYKNKFNIGWCDIKIKYNLKQNFLKNNSSFFFCHSFFLKLNSKEDKKSVLGEIDFNKILLPALIIKENIIGAQFHPEKSQTNGIQFLNFFIDKF